MKDPLDNPHSESQIRFAKKSGVAQCFAPKQKLVKPEKRLSMHGLRGNFFQTNVCPGMHSTLLYVHHAASQTITCIALGKYMRKKFEAFE